MLAKDQGIVLAASRSGDTSLLVTFLARAAGKIRLMAKGVLASRHPSRGLLEPGNHLEVLYYQREGRTLYFLKEASLISAPERPRDSLEHMAAMLAAVELLDQVCYSGATDEAAVDVGIEYVRAPAAVDPLLVFLAFEMRLLAVLGVDPDLSRCARCGAGATGGSYSAKSGESLCPRHDEGAPEAIALTPGLVELASHCLGRPLASIAGMSVERVSRKDLGKLVHWTYTFHVHGYRLPNSLNLI